MFLDCGFDNWKKALQRFSRHQQSGSHKEAVLLLKQEIVCLLNKLELSDQKFHGETLLKQLSSGHDNIERNLLQLLTLRIEDCPELNLGSGIENICHWT